MNSNSTAAAMCCIPNPARTKYRQKSLCTIQKPNERLFGNRCSGRLQEEQGMILQVILEGLGLGVLLVLALGLVLLRKMTKNGEFKEVEIRR